MKLKFFRRKPRLTRAQRTEMHWNKARDYLEKRDPPSLFIEEHIERQMKDLFDSNTWTRENDRPTIHNMALGYSYSQNPIKGWLMRHCFETTFLTTLIGGATFIAYFFPPPGDRPSALAATTVFVIYAIGCGSLPQFLSRLIDDSASEAFKAWYLSSKKSSIAHHSKPSST